MSRKNRQADADALQREIIHYLNSRPDGASARQILRALKIPGQKQNSFWKSLNQLKQDRQITQSSGSHYTTRSYSKKQTRTGLFHRKISGSGEVIPSDSAYRMTLSKSEACFLVDGDLVEVVSTDASTKGIPRGMFRSILKRRETPIVGYYRLIRDEPAFVPLDPRIAQTMRIASLPDAQPNDVISIIVLDDRTDPGYPIAVPQATFGPREAFGVQTSILTVKHQIRENWTQNALDEAAAFPDITMVREPEDREDLREELVITVDPEDARDYDDGLSLEMNSDGFLLGVHIADVSHFVQPGSAIDKEAYLRGTSVYLPERAIHMLPERLAADLCSLRPDLDRLAVTVWIRFSPDGERLDSRCCESVIRSKARLTYADFQRFINNTDDSTEPVSVLCRNLNRLFLILQKQRVSRGVLDLDIPETHYHFDSDGRISAITRKARGNAEQAIEEFMIAANIVVAEKLDTLGLPHIKRHHEPPDLSTIQELKTNLTRLGIIPPSNPLNPDQVRAMLSSIESDAVRSVASYLILRSMKRAVYTTQNSGHYGLALDQYTQFTSPIRRYPDLLVHRSLKHAMHPESEWNPDASELESMSKWLCERERKAQETEWEAQKLQKIRFIQPRIGDVFEASVTHIEEFGVFVELDDPFVEGCIPIFKMDRSLKIDYRRGVIVSRDGMILRAGSRIKVRLEMADLDRSLLDFAFVLPASGASKKLRSENADFIQ